MYLDLTNKQIKIIKHIKDMLTQKGYPPTIRELCQHVGVNSTSHVHSNLNKLEKLGYIKRDPSKPRAIELLEKENFSNGLHQEVIDLPVIKQNIAVKPIDSDDNIEEYMKLPSNLVIGKESFIMKVNDKSMVNVGILEDDYIIVDKSYNKLNSNIVVLVVDNKIIIRRFFSQEDGYIRLESENECIDDIRVHKSKADILGVVRGNFRVIK
ncbi:transcriptional repressor LexA [Paraclostridium sordellii]|uniref:transcriptional repressor LexA n=1 Tax=Paraclostridium sordellii TaxID=1505 RepID=UPI000C77FD1B|nr:transcriptional repressor LexA [Paeniclostridium sordellii]AUN12784.1 repressor LexA [Paeniclostridium sordellii]